MMIFFKRVLMILVVVMMVLLEPATAVRARGLNLPERRDKLTHLIIEPLKPIITGDHPNIVVHLISEFGKPLPNQPIIILVDGKRKGDGKTDSNGTAAITLKYKFPAGTYQISALYPGVVSIGLPSATARTEMVVEAAKLEIYTIPPTPGVVFVLDGQTYTTMKTE
jgi:hypothetical protein